MRKQFSRAGLLALACASFCFTSCNNDKKEGPEEKPADNAAVQKKEPISQPLISSIYTADPSAHVFNGRIYIYPSHDTATGTPEDDLGGHFDMRDYHILSMDAVGGTVTDHGVGLDIKNIPMGSEGFHMGKDL